MRCIYMYVFNFSEANGQSWFFRMKHFIHSGAPIPVRMKPGNLSWKTLSLRQPKRWWASMATKTAPLRWACCTTITRYARLRCWNLMTAQDALDSTACKTVICWENVMQVASPVTINSLMSALTYCGSKLNICNHRIKGLFLKWVK